MKRVNTTWVLFFIVIAFIYVSYLNRAPVHFNQDELGFSLNAYSIAKTGSDENGRFFPLYFWHLGLMYSTPIIVYLTSLFLLFLPLAENTVRLSSVAVGLTDVILIYFLAKEIFKQKRYGFFAAFLLAFTPVHFMQSRILLDNLYPLPFILGWLLSVFLYLKDKRIRWLFLSTFLLGVGIHSYHSAKIMMTLYLIFTFIVLATRFRKKIEAFVFAFLGLCVSLLPFIFWLSKYPDTLSDQIKYTRLYDPSLSLLEGILSLLRPEILTEKIKVFIAYFNPYFLFIDGDISLTHTTHKTGVFVYVLAILIPLGIYQILKNRKNVFNIVILLGFFSSPFAASLVGEYYMSSRMLVILPFAIIISVFGLDFLINEFPKHSKKIISVIVVLVLLQFIYFINDYYTDYRIRSYSMFKYNIPGALESILEDIRNDSSEKIYLSRDIDFIDRYWRFFVYKHQQTEILNRTYYFDPLTTNISLIPQGSLMLLRFDQLDENYKNNLQLKSYQEITEPDGFVSFYIYRN